MRIIFTGRQTEISPALQRYTVERLEKLKRLLRDGFDLHVILTAEKHRRIAELTLRSRHHVMVGIKETADARQSISGAVEKLNRQAVRLLERRRARKRRARPASAVLLNVFGPSGPERDEGQLLETERIPIKPMTVEEAAVAGDMKRRGMVVFRNAATERVNVLYRRADGNLGLIEPEP